jgi:aspartyl-tRNA(Asn)/glutamyl-tRNA(Gln) amidotransferase subunit A
MDRGHRRLRRDVLKAMAAGAAMLASPLGIGKAFADHGRVPLPGSIADAGKLLKSGHVSVTELITTFLRGARTLQPVLDSFITITEQTALATATALDNELRRGKSRGPLHGIPVVYKDNIDTAGILTTRGSAFFQSRVATSDAEVVRKLKNAGAVLVGKANMNEFAAGVAGFNQFYGTAGNPWDLLRWPGGSSSGSGVSVSAGLALAGLGTDTGVSVRGPASWLGLVGVRPSYGRVSVRGTFPRAQSFDTVGPLTRTVADAATMLQAIAGFDPLDPFAVKAPNDDFGADIGRGVRGLRLGIVEDFTFRNVDPEVQRVVEKAIGRLESAGAQIKTVPIPLLSGKIDFQYPLTILLYEFNQILGDTFRAAPDKSLFGPVVQANIAQGEAITRAAYDARVAGRPAEIEEIRKVFDSVDAFITPTHAFVAPPLTVAAEGDPGVRQFTVPISYTGFPAVTVPCGFNSAGLPVGMQIVAEDFEERLLFRIAAEVEDNTRGVPTTPPIHWNEEIDA